MTARALERGWRIVGTGLSFALFGIACVLLAVTVCPLIALLTRDEDVRSRRVQWVIHRGCAFFVGVMKLFGLLTSELHGREWLRAGPGRMVVANHPSLIDAVFLLSWLPQADCIVKQALTVNPFTRWIVAWAGYVANSAPDELVMRCAEKLAAGRTLIVFPEGTRTVPGRTPVFRRGAARVALLSNAEVVPVQIRCEPATLIKGEKWWQVPERPPHWTFVVSAPFDACRQMHADDAPAVAARRLTRHLESVLVPASARPQVEAEAAALSLP